MREKVEEIVRPKVEELTAPIFPSALELLDRMLPESPVADVLAIPLEQARVICAIDEQQAA